MRICQNFLVLSTIVLSCSRILNGVGLFGRSFNERVRGYQDGLSRTRMGRLLGLRRNEVEQSAPLSETWLTAPELIQRNGYPFELHTITTKDGYILIAHRIPNPGKPPIIMFHGMSQTSRDFLMNRKHKAPAYKMYESGFDIWLVNVRGNSYSQGHVRLSTNDQEYWNFSIDEVIKYDATSLIDYVINATGQPKVNWIGYSLGTAVGLGVAASVPEYNDKIENLILLGTIAYVDHTRSPYVNIARPFEKLLDIILTKYNRGEMLPRFFYPLLRAGLPILCLPEAKLRIPGICSVILSLIGGFNVNQGNPEMIPMIFGGTPGTLAIQMITQWLQWVNSGRFTYKDHGRTRNFAKYGTAEPPNYNLKNVTTRVINFYSDNDWLSHPKDVQKAVDELPNVGLNIRVPMRAWSHLDFLYGKDTDRYVFQEIASAINMFRAIS